MRIPVPLQKMNFTGANTYRDFNSNEVDSSAQTMRVSQPLPLTKLGGGRNDKTDLFNKSNYSYH